MRNTVTSFVLLAMIGICGGCREMARVQYEKPQMLARRQVAATRYAAETDQYLSAFIAGIKAELDEHQAGRRAQPPVIDFLIVSGGGDWGAFGAGFLKGWGRISKSDPMTRPQFEIVTGVSTGALIAPFAFVGDDEAIERIVQLFRNPRKDWVKQRGLLFWLPNHISFAEVPGLERDLAANVNVDLAKRIVATGTRGRMLAVNTTNLDDGSPHAFQLIPEMQRAVETGDLKRVHQILLASSGIPGAFPYREIDGQMYVDGAVTSNVIYGGRLGEENSLPALWQKLYPETPMPKLRYWVIFNNYLNPPPVVVRARWLDIIGRSVEVSSRSATVTALRHLQAMVEISRLERKSDIELRLVTIPDEWVPPKPGVFVKETMNDLADLGEKMGADAASWNTGPIAP